MSIIAGLVLMSGLICVYCAVNKEEYYSTCIRMGYILSSVGAGLFATTL